MTHDGRLNQARDLFTLPRDVVYLNCAYMSPLLKTVAEAGYAGVNRKATPWQTGPADFFDESNQVRELFAQLVGGRGTDVALVPSVSYGIGVAARNVAVPRGSRIVVLAEQFPSNVYPWMEKARQCEASLYQVPRPSDGDWTPAVLAALNPGTSVAALPHCHWTDGSLLDLAAIGAACREQDIALVLDLTQSLGALPFAIDDVQPAFIAVAGYKWLMGPYSTAFLYVHPDYQKGVPLEYNWITRAGSENFGGLVAYTDQLVDDASRYDVGERSNFTLLPMSGAALRQILTWQPAAIQQHLRQYTDRLAEGARQYGFESLPPHRRAGHMLGLHAAGRLPDTLAKAMADRGIYISIRGASMRVSPHLYNDERDLTRFLDALAELTG